MSPSPDRNDIPNTGPIYLTIARNLRRQIEEGLLIPGAQIPTEQELAREYGVSRITARGAVKELQNLGLVVRTQGKGSFVADLAEETPVAAARLGTELPIISVVLPIGRHAGHDMLSSIESAARAQGYHVTFHNSLFEPFHEREIVEEVVRGGSRGVIVYPCMGVRNVPVFSRLLAQRFPLVFIDRSADGISVPTVRCDNYAGFAAITGHVLDRGHRRIAFFGNHPSLLESERERLRGFCDTCVCAGVAVRDEYLVATGEHEHEMSEPGGLGRSGSGITAISAALERLLALPEPPTCVMAVNDVTAFHLFRVARTLGRGIPEELSITGFDDLEVGAHLSVPLTTVHQSFEELGRSATELLFAMIAGAPGGTNVVVETRLVVRESVRELCPESGVLRVAGQETTEPAGADPVPRLKE